MKITFIRLLNILHVFANDMKTNYSYNYIVSYCSFNEIHYILSNESYHYSRS